MNIVIIRHDLENENGDPLSQIARNEAGVAQYFNDESAASAFARANNIDDYDLDDLDRIAPVVEDENEGEEGDEN